MAMRRLLPLASRHTALRWRARQHGEGTWKSRWEGVKGLRMLLRVYAGPRHIMTSNLPQHRSSAQASGWKVLQ
jgi:hypothetical protein